MGSPGYRVLSLPSHTPSMGFSHLPTLQMLSLSLAFHCSTESKPRHSYHDKADLGPILASACPYNWLAGTQGLYPSVWLHL